MSVTASRKVIVEFTGDVQAGNIFAAANNAASPGQMELQTLTTGDNTITPPADVTSVTIIPPAGNTELITVKGSTGDTGIAIHKTDPTSMGLDTTATTLIFNTASTTGIEAVRLVWT